MKLPKPNTIPQPELAEWLQGVSDDVFFSEWARRKSLRTIGSPGGRPRAVCGVCGKIDNPKCDTCAARIKTRERVANYYDRNGYPETKGRKRWRKIKETGK